MVVVGGVVEFGGGSTVDVTSTLHTLLGRQLQPSSTTTGLALDITLLLYFARICARFVVVLYDTLMKTMQLFVENRKWSKTE